jgi:hypothetical protein
MLRAHPDSSGRGDGLTLVADNRFATRSKDLTVGHAVFLGPGMNQYQVSLLAHEYVHVLQQAADLFQYDHYTRAEFVALDRNLEGQGAGNRFEALPYIWQKWLDAYWMVDFNRPGGARPSW